MSCKYILGNKEYTEQEILSYISDNKNAIIKENEIEKVDSVYINKDTADDSVLLHEFNHLYNNWLKQNRPQVYNKGLALISAELDKTPTVTVNERTRKQEVDVDNNGNSIFEDVTDQEFNIEFPNGARAFGTIKNGIADLTQINAPKGVQGNKTYERLLFELNKLGINSLRVKLQSTDSRKTLTALLNKEILSNPRDLTGVSIDQYPTLFDFSAEKISTEISEIQEIINFVKATQPNLAGEKLYEEILTELVGRRGIEILIKKENSKSDVLSWLAEVWQEIKNMLGLSSYTDAQILNMTLMEFADASAIDLLRGESFTGKNGEQNFNKWKGDNKMVDSSDLSDVKTGQPIVAKVYHGTTNEFYEFDSSIKGNVEGHLGKVNYFTSDYQDASQNYLSEGADITVRIYTRAEEIQSQMEFEFGVSDSASFTISGEEGDLVDKNLIQEILNYFNSKLNIEDYIIDEYENIDIENFSKTISKNQIQGNAEKVLEVYVKLNNPVVLGNGNSYADLTDRAQFEEYLEDATQEIADENNISVEEAKEEYLWDIENKAMEMADYQNPINKALEKAISDNTYDYERASQKASTILSDFYESEINLFQLEIRLREELLNEQNDNGELSSSQIVADFFKNLGFDGIILTDASKRFQNMGLGANTSHIHVFDEFNNQIKLADGSNISFGETSDIRFQKAIEPQPNFNGYSTYKEAVKNTPINEKIKIQIDDVVIAEITNNGDVNDLIRQGIIEDRRELEPSGAITYKTSGANLTMKLVNAHIAKEVLGGKINKAGDIRTEQKEEVEISDNFETNKKELGENAAISILASDALAENTPAFGVGRIITEEIEIPNETVLMTKLKGLLNQLGVKSMSLEAWEKKNGKKAASNALADIGNQIVAFADGKITEDQLSEETAHFIIEALDQEQIKPLLEVVHKTDEWKQYAQTYMEIYKDEAIVRREILGKVLKNALQRKAQETLQGQSVVDRIIGFFNNFIDSVRNLLSDNSRQQLDKFTNEVYEKLMAEELYNELSPEQFDGNKLVMYQAQVNDTVYQSISKLTKQMGVIDRRLNSAQKETLSQIEKNLEMADEAMQLEALAGLASVLKKHVTYLNTRGRKQGFLSTEESFVYNTTEDIGKALQSLMPKIEVSVFKKEKEKAMESAQEALTALSELSANLNKEKGDRFQDIVTDLVEKNGLSDHQKDILLKEIKSQSRDTNTFYSWFGGAIHAQNSILNMLAKRVSKMNKETNAVFSQEANTFFSKMNELGFKDEQIAPLMKKWARGNYLFSPYDFVAEEMQANKIRLEVIKKEAKDVYDEYLKTLKTEDKVLEHFSKNQDEWLSKLTQEQNSNYRYLAKEAISDAGLRLDALNKAEREDFNKVMKSLNLSLKTKKLIQEFKDKKNRIFRESKINNGFSEEDLQQLQEINSDYQVASEPYDKDGNIKDGLLIDENGVITASVPKDQLEDDVRVTLELNEYREALKQLYAGKERNVFEGFFNQLQEVKNSATDPIERRRNIENFIKLNTRVFYTEEFWQQSDKNDSIVNKLLELETEEATQIAEEIEFLNRKLKNILKRNKLYNRPSQIDFEFMSAADESEVKDLVTHLETKFREAKTQLPKSEGQTIERAFQSVTNEAYQKELTNRAIAVSNSGVNNEQFVEKLDFIRQHVTDEGMRSINRIRDRVASFDLTKDVPKGLNITKEELMADKNKAVLDYAETKLMPYFKVIQSNKEGASQAENNLIFEMGQSQNAQELESVYNKYKTEYFIDASPSFIFEDADTSDRLNKEYKKRLESNEPLLSDKFFNKEFFDYFGINIGQGFSIDTAVATKNQKEFEAWKATVGFQEKVLEYGSMKGKHNKYLLPQYRRGTYARGEQIAKGMSREKIKEAFNDAFTYREDDPALGQNVDGEISQIYQKNSLVIPKTGFRRLEAETEVTDELLYSYMLMMREAVKFNKRTEAWADVEAMEHYIKGKTYGDKFGEATNTYKMFNDFKRYNIYGQREAWSWETDMYGLLPKKQNLAPAVNFFQRYVRNNNLAYSILTPMTSFLQGTTNFFVENLVGDRINKDASRLASKEMPKLMTQASSEFFNVRAKSKLNLLLQFMGQDSPSERFDNSNYGKALRGASIYKSGYISHYLGDVPIQAQTTLTVLHDYRIIGNDIIDYYSWRRKNRTLTEKQAKAQWKTYQDNVIYNHIKPTKDGSLEVDQTVKNIDGWEAKIQQMRDKLTIAKQDIDNQISEGDKGMVQRHALLSWTTLHKGWLVTSMTKRFKEQHLNLFNNMMEEGTYRGTFYFLTNFMKDIKGKGIKNAWKENFKGYDGGYRLEGNIIYDDKGDILKAFDNKKEAEEYYEELKFDFAKMRQISVTRAGIDLVLTSALATLGILLSKMADDDDDDFVKEFVAYSTFRLASEVSSQSFAFPAQAYAFLESPTVGMSQLQNSLDVLDVFDTENISRGNYKGYSKQQAWFLKAIPGIKELGKLYNIDRTRNSFEFYNTKNLKFTVAGQILLED